ncbi:MAG: hypothetical protein JWQ88_3658 [Rhodoferax sp.]|nr:hypothetical protein [Rhodoferax sp.]
MDNIRKFPRTSVRPEVTGAVHDRLNSGSHKRQGHAAPPTVADTVGKQVVQALKFYARGGFDHGEAAQKALIAMQTALEANHQAT